MLIQILGNPIAQQRHRDTIRKGKRCKYDPLSTEKALFRKELQSGFNKYIYAFDRILNDEAETILECDYYSVSIHFYFPINESDSLCQKNLKLWNLQRCDNNKDLDNLEKFVLDCMKDIFFVDDRKVTVLESFKTYSDQPRTEINIKGYFMKESVASDILSLISPTQLKDLQGICKRIASLSPDIESGIYEIAGSLSEISEMTSSYLPKIKKKYPGYYLTGESDDT